MESYQNINGWFDFEEVYDLVIDSLPNNSHIVEVGACFGKSTAYLARRIIESGKDIKLDVVDIWKNNYNVFFANMVRNEVARIIKPMRMTSHMASLHYADESLDFVFIDAGHKYSEVRTDIYSWFPKIKKGAIFAGHDYHLHSVKKAVDEQFNVIVKQNCWIYSKSLGEVHDFAS
jgi:predicted O-methyltransferase YrrM